MRKKRQPIFELLQKINFLIRESVAVKVHGCESVNQLGRKAFSSDTGCSALKSSITARGLSSDHQTKLACCCGFRVDWVEWVDPAADRDTPADRRRDTAEAFKKRYREQSSARTAAAMQSKSEMGVRLKATRPYAPEAADSMLASVELNVSQAGPADPWFLSADLVCLSSPIGGIEIAVKRGRLEFDCAGAQSVALKDRTGFPSGYTIEREDSKMVLRPYGNSQRPGWEVQANDVIGGLALPHDFCPVIDVRASEEIKVCFSVYVKDLELTECEDTDNEPVGEGEPENESHSFIRPGMKKLGAAKEKILKRMAEMQLPGGGNGWSVLCRDARRFDSTDDQ